MKIRISGIQKESSVDGQGLRYVVFTQGCKHNCPGCHNPETHSFTGGYFVDTKEIAQDLAKNKILRGITVSGGDPMEQPLALLDLVKQVKEMKKTVWVYTGYKYEELVKKHDETINEILSNIDVLVDGKYISNLHKEGLRYRGSSNQRVIDCKKTLEYGRIILMPC